MAQRNVSLRALLSPPTSTGLVAGFALSWLLPSAVVAVITIVKGPAEFEWGVGAAALLYGIVVTATYLASALLLVGLCALGAAPLRRVWRGLLAAPFVVTPAWFFLFKEALPGGWHFALFAAMATIIGLPLIRLGRSGKAVAASDL
jgi:hypothetical protein